MSHVLYRAEICFNSNRTNNHRGLWIKGYGKDDFEIGEIVIHNDNYDDNKVFELYKILNELGVSTNMRYDDVSVEEKIEV